MWQEPDLPLDVMLNKVEAVRRLTDDAARKEAIRQLIEKREVTTQRLFLGKQRDNSTVLTMSDIKGKPRIKMMVTEAGTPRLDFLDEQGKVIYSLPEANKADKK
jgi:hypothetical protein